MEHEPSLQREVVRCNPARSRLTCVLLAGSLVSVACQKAPVPFVGEVSRSKYFEYHDQVREDLCPSLLSLLDKHAEMIGGLVGMSLVTGEPIFRYYRYQDYANYSQAFSESGGSTIGTSVYSPSYFSDHELVHAYVHRAWGEVSPPSLLREGVAVALSCDPVEAIVGGSYDWRDFLRFLGETRFGYSLAGHFVTYLIRQYGMQKFIQLFHAVPDAADAADFEAEFARIYPTSMDSAWRGATDIADLGLPTKGCIGEWRCWASGPLTKGEEVTQDCSNNTHRTITIGASEAGMVLLKSGSDVDVWRNCLEDSIPYLVLRDYLQQTTLHWVVMAPGTYTLTSSGQVDIHLKDYLPAPSLGDTCEAAGEVQLDGDWVTQINLPSDAGISGWIRLAGAVGKFYDVTPQAMVLSEDPTASGLGSSVSYCDSCTPAATCVFIKPGAAQTIFVTSGSVLHLQNIDTRGQNVEGIGLWFHPVQAGADR